MIETETVIDTCKTKKRQPQHLAEAILDKIAGGWVNAFANWTKSF
ncbi:TPA: XyeA family putative rSAM-modified RiPP [Yersinia enterocolitica]|nr:XyeA family putative rSAM-modified RiPP [Yersinia enterocolitica]